MQVWSSWHAVMVNVVPNAVVSGAAAAINTARAWWLQVATCGLDL